MNSQTITRPKAVPVRPKVGSGQWQTHAARAQVQSETLPSSIPQRLETNEVHFVLLLLSFAYLAFGQFWWTRIVFASPAPDQTEQWRKALIEADARSDIALLIAKGTFILRWPLALAFRLGFGAADVGCNWLHRCQT